MLNNFTLPTFSKAVPTQTIYSGSSVTNLTKSLIQIGIIKVGSLPNNCITPSEILHAGLLHWLRGQTGTLRRIVFNAGVSSDTAIEERLQYMEKQKKIRAGTHLSMEAVQSPGAYLIKEAVEFFGTRHPGLVRTALASVVQASRKTVEVWTPEFAFDWYVGTTWDEPVWKSIPTDGDVRETLFDRFDTGEEESTETLVAMNSPSTIIPAFGGHEVLCATIQNADVAILTEKRLRQIERSKNCQRSAALSKAILQLKKALKQAEKIGARLPSLSDVNASCLFPACCLAYDLHPEVTAAIDSYVQYLQEGGDATDLLGYEALPESTFELFKYFEKLSCAFAVVRCMDTVIFELTNFSNQEPQWN